MVFIILYMVGVLVAWVQLQYWFKDRILLNEDFQVLTALSFLSWLVYPIYLIAYLMDYLDSNEDDSKRD
jgi:hypothetical protein